MFEMGHNQHCYCSWPSLANQENFSKTAKFQPILCSGCIIENGDLCARMTFKPFSFKSYYASV